MKINALNTFFAPILVAAASMQAFVPVSYADVNSGSEQSTITLDRNASSQAELNGRLTKNVYRYITHEETYTVEVPYTVRVPFRYWETYYENERVCRNVPYTFPVCHTETYCPPRPPRAPCHTQNVCHNETRYRQECRIESIPRQREVIGYRDEIRYRTETRTRTVTEQIFDHQYDVQVAVQFPAGSQLQGNETESVLISLTGTEQQPDAIVQVDSTIFSYPMINKQLNGRTLVVQLALQGKYQPADLAEKTLTNLSLARTSPAINSVVFDDLGLLGRTMSQYHLLVLDSETGAKIAEQDLTGVHGVRHISIPVTGKIREDQDVTIRLRVKREGPSIIGGTTEFQIETRDSAELTTAAR